MLRKIPGEGAARGGGGLAGAFLGGAGLGGGGFFGGRLGAAPCSALNGSEPKESFSNPPGLFAGAEDTGANGS
jgi:hypothetical protein